MRAVKIEKDNVRKGLHLVISSHPNDHGVVSFHFGQVVSLFQSMIQLEDGYTIRTQFGETIGREVWETFTAPFNIGMVYELSPAGSAI